MLVKGLTDTELKNIAKKLGVEPYNFRPKGKGFAFVLRPFGETYRRRSHTGRRIWAVCWHGYRDYMREVFKLNPDAQIVTAHANYKGLDGFEHLYRNTGHANIGSMMSPMQYADACECGEGAR